MTEPVRHRDRVRAGTVREIKQTARDLLVADGPEGVSLRAIARRMGMTAPALYRYFPSREDLLGELTSDLYAEVTDAMTTALAEEPTGDPGIRLVVASRRFRHWSLAHRREFGLLFGAPVAGFSAEPAEAAEHAGSPKFEAGIRFAGVFAGLMAEVYRRNPFPIEADSALPDGLRSDLASWCARAFPVPVPLGLLQVFLSAWIRLYGLVSMEVFGHLRFAVADAEAVFEHELVLLAPLLGFDLREIEAKLAAARS
jgi:AcrR family transcriptional regulator